MSKNCLNCVYRRVNPVGGMVCVYGNKIDVLRENKSCKHYQFKDWFVEGWKAIEGIHNEHTTR